MDTKQQIRLFVCNLFPYLESQVKVTCVLSYLKILNVQQQQYLIKFLKKNFLIYHPRSPPTSRKFSTTTAPQVPATGNAGSNGVQQSNGHLSSTVATRNNRSRSRSPALNRKQQQQQTVEPSQVSTAFLSCM